MRFNREEVRLIPAPGAFSHAGLLVDAADSRIVHRSGWPLTRSFPLGGSNGGPYFFDTARIAPRHPSSLLKKPTVAEITWRRSKSNRRSDPHAAVL